MFFVELRQGQYPLLAKGEDVLLVCEEGQFICPAAKQRGASGKQGRAFSRRR